MKQVMNVNGAVLHSEREYDIAKSTAVTIGQVVKLEEGLVVPAAAGETGAILGYAAESHTGTADALNGRNDGVKILVQDAPDAIAVSPAPRVTASGGSATTVKVDSMPSFAAAVFNGGYLKAAATGKVRRITDSAVASGVLTLTVEAGDAAAEGDEFILFPPVGFSAGNLDTAGCKLVLTATAALPLRVVGRDEKGNNIYTMAAKHQLAVGQ